MKFKKNNLQKLEIKEFRMVCRAKIAAQRDKGTLFFAPKNMIRRLFGMGFVEEAPRTVTAGKK
ncbi:hypothetical protein [Comamonas sp. GB3 AK4-5]|uniref:hypothetical protein n=1 Tax=Comamonas sp. GB3 AK4-5 TaxID=3231487 RepID=UPI00351DEC5D